MCLHSLFATLKRHGLKSQVKKKNESCKELKSILMGTGYVTEMSLEE